MAPDVIGRRGPDRAGSFFLCNLNNSESESFKMRNNSINRSLIAVVIAGLMTWSTTAQAGSILYSQPYDEVSPGVSSQVFTDYPTYSTKAFDDVTVTGGGWLVQGVTIYGQEQGDPTQNVSVNFQFASSPNFNDPSPVYTGTEDASGNLDFSGLNISLSPGTYWITAWVVRPELSTGGQWFWSMTDAGSPIGSEFYVQNPGGGLIPGATSAVAGSSVLGTLPSDLAFTITGQSVPEPSSLVLLGSGRWACWPLSGDAEPGRSDGLLRRWG